MAIDLASIILHRSSSDAQARSQAADIRARRRARSDEELYSFAKTIGSLPVLIKKAQDEQEETDLSNAATGGYTQGGADGMLSAIAGINTKSLSASQAKLRLLAQGYTLKNQDIARQAQLETMKLQREQAARESADFTQRQRSLAASRGVAKAMTSPVLDASYNAPTGFEALPYPEVVPWLPLPQAGPSWRAPTLSEGLQAASQVPDVSLTDLQPFLLSRETSERAREAEGAKTDRSSSLNALRDMDARVAEQKLHENDRKQAVSIAYTRQVSDGQGGSREPTIEEAERAAAEAGASPSEIKDLTAGRVAQQKQKSLDLFRQNKSKTDQARIDLLQTESTWRQALAQAGLDERKAMRTDRRALQAVTTLFSKADAAVKYTEGLLLALDGPAGAAMDGDVLEANKKQYREALQIAKQAKDHYDEMLNELYNTPAGEQGGEDEFDKFMKFARKKLGE